MMKLWRPLALAAALTVAAGAGVAAAQTIIVRNAPAGESIELVLNGTTSATATVEPGGESTLVGKMRETTGKTEIDAYIFVDACDKKHRVLLVERGQQPPPPEAGCIRREVSGLYWVRVGSTLVMNVAGPNPSILLRQSRFRLEDQGPRKPLPTGLDLFGGSGLMKFRDAVSLACGNAPQCTSRDSGIPYAAGATYWFMRYVAAEGSYVKPAEVTQNGSGSGYSFTSSLDVRFVTMAGKVGVPIGPVRLYGKVGGTYHQATSRSTETIDDQTVTVDDVPQVIKGGTQRFELETAGWGWLFGGGLEIWVKPRFAVYGEAGRAALKGDSTSGGEARFDDRVNFALFGVRVALTR